MAELTTIARPYAEALFQVARKGDVAAWGRQIEALSQVAQNQQVRQFADSPKASDEQVVDLVSTAAQLPLEPGVQNFLRALVANGRLVALPAIAEQFHALVNASSGVEIGRAHV